MVMSAIRFDMRRAPFSPVSEADQYAECVRMTAWADRHGFGAVTVSEHHGVDFVSAPLALAGLLLGCTRDARVMVNALLLPLHDPVRLAEQIATLDLASGGRLSCVAGLGYRPDEFAMAGVDRSRRGAEFEEHVEVMLRAWTGEPFEWRGRTIVVTPRPARPAQQLLFLGGSVAASAERAARFRLPFFTMSDSAALRERYAAACREAGYDDGFVMYPTGPSFVLVSEDPDRTWDAIGRYALYDAQSYRSWQTGDHDNAIAIEAQTVDDLERSGRWKVVTPEECVSLALHQGSVVLHPLMGGMPFDLGWESLHLYVNEVIPAIAAATPVAN
jgi:alkanesulfonate monooxygenase SsuD/methylene tetrahydromethanopterin reductase-like flavin-dependent oxidoreductase (luciferase family)